MSDEQGEPGDPEPLLTVATLLVLGFTAAAFGAVGDWLRCLDSLRRWL